MIQCQVCRIRMQFQQNFLAHMQTDQALQCVSCLEDFDSLCALRNHRQLVHPREFEESQRMMMDAGIAAKLSPPRSSTDNICGSAPKKVGSAVTAPGTGEIDFVFDNTEDRVHSEGKVATGLQQYGSPQSGNFSIPLLKPDPFHGQQREIAKGGDLIGLCGPDEEASDLDKAVEALIESIRKQTEQSEGSSLVNPTEYCMSEYPCSTISDQVNNHAGHSNAVSVGRIEIAKRKLATFKQEDEGTDESVSSSSTGSTRFYTPQAENSDLVQGAKPSEMKQSEGLEVVRADGLSQSAQTPASMQQEHDAGVRIVCFQCEATFSTITELQHHQIMHEHNYCKLCFGFFNDCSLLERHIQLMHSFKCIGCQSTYPSWEEKTKHQRQTGHGYCKECNCYFKDRVSHAKHHSLHSNYEKFACPICKANFKTQESRNMHQSDTRHAYCKECDCNFQDHATYVKHVNVHNGTGFVCPTCEAIFSTERNRDTHQREKEHAVCLRCDKIFPDKASAKGHIGVAHKHKCTESGCKLSFPTPALLEAHIWKSHHVCKPCNRTFVDKMALLSHERSGKHAKQVLS
ncbi:hypothetical protein ACJ72_06352 [Emergomyces africanus]|uniref:C2H2-type domain-containing protein n=1 Tax=Emergomyces africanus TaxID=1955775 RepID=A0A1B7NRB1_9EURO|nr:hypothetical protein ACJ72_06352 [Emergomyces africanus]